ncbi:MAG: PKD domain-containing protein [Dyadobacter sp.]|uniref:PKD domain-containing protein n=1 Tax=Dyadobacter sp. TaxID=1914288 RepID=UPI0032661748
MKTVRCLISGIAVLVMLHSCTLVDHVPVPTVDFSVSPGNEGQVVFNLISSNTDSYSWDFGDGASSSERSPTHSYRLNGRYLVSVTASGNAGEVSVKKEISVTNITGSAVFHTYDFGGLPVQVFVDDILVGTAIFAHRVIAPRCGQDGAVTAYNLNEGTHKYELRQIQKPNPQTQRGSFTIIGGQCTNQSFYFFF